MRRSIIYDDVANRVGWASMQAEGAAVVVDRASDLLEPGEEAIVLFIRDRNLVKMDSQGSGTSGNWPINPEQHGRPDKVIIYNRLQGEIPRQAEVYLADYMDSEESEQDGRLVIKFQRAKLVGTTTENWSEFAETGANPVRYLSKK